VPGRPIASGDIPTTELVEAAIRRIERLNPTLSPVVTLMFDRALAESREGMPAARTSPSSAPAPPTTLR
jgi:Asp-tRNA(Asn)/Glu-tRNA(Gln) amidotransferase A subunit family amidase